MTILYIYIYCLLQVVTIDRERLISEKQNNRASAESERLPKGVMLLRDIFSNLQSHSWTRFVLLDSLAGLVKGKEIPPNSINVDFYKTS